MPRAPTPRTLRTVASPRWTRALCPVLLACATAAHAGPASSSDAGRAAALYDEGKRHFDIGEYAAAIASWKQSYLLSSAPLLLFNIGQAYRLAGNCAQANRFYLNYQRAVPRPPNRAELEQAMAKCAGVAPAIGEDDATDSAGAAGAAGVPGTGAVTTSGAGSSGSEHPATGPSSPATGPNSPATGPNSPATGPNSPATGPNSPPTGASHATSTSALTASGALSAHAHADEIHPEHGRGLRVAGVVTGAIGIAAGATAVVLGVQAGQHASTVHGEPPGTVWTGSLSGEQSAGQNAALGADVLAAVAGAAVIGGGMMWWLGHRAERTHVAAVIAPGHAEVSLSCVF